MSNPLSRVTPQEAGINPQRLTTLYQFLKDPSLGIHSFMVLRHGKVVSEAWWDPYAPEKPHTLFSASKTFTGLAVCFAAQDGALSLEDRVVSWFQEQLPARTCANMEKMTVRHLLTMSTGFAKDPHDFPWPRPDDILATGPHCCHQGREFPQIDWVRNFFNHYVAYEPGTEFVYCTHGTYMLSAIVQRAVGKTLFEYLTEKLFSPLGIESASWELGPDGYNVGGWGLMLTTEDLAKVGQFLLNGGVWDGTQLLSRQWVREAASVHVTMGHLDEPHIAGYGYQIWVDQREGCFCLRGAFGQICAVIPGKDMVIVYTGGSNAPERRIVWEKIWDLLVDSVDRDSPVGGEQELTQLTRSMCIPPAAGSPSWETPQAAQWSGRHYRLGDNRLNFTSISIRFSGAPDRPDFLTLGLRKNSFTVPIGYGCWCSGKTCVRTSETDTDVSVIFESVSCSGAWREGSYHIQLCFDETSYINTMELTFSDGGVILRHNRNCTFFSAIKTTLTGVETPLK